jgi:flagellar hook assembly protein FlgD
VALLLASLSALYLNQRIRRDGLVLDSIHVTPRFSPNGDGDHDRARISFRIKGPDEIDLDVLDSSGDRVRRLAAGRTLGDRVVTRFRWDGRTDAGGEAPAGVYTLRIRERRRERTVTPSEQIALSRGGAGG